MQTTASDLAALDAALARDAQAQARAERRASLQDSRKVAYRAALRRYLGPEGKFRIGADGTIHAKIGTWIVFGRMGDPRTRATLLQAQVGEALL